MVSSVLPSRVFCRSYLMKTEFNSHFSSPALSLQRMFPPHLNKDLWFYLNSFIQRGFRVSSPILQCQGCHGTMAARFHSSLSKIQQVERTSKKNHVFKSFVEAVESKIRSLFVWTEMLPDSSDLCWTLTCRRSSTSTLGLTSLSESSDCLYPCLNFWMVKENKQQNSRGRV